MSNASDYPVTFPFGAVDGTYYTAQKPHHGNDRAIPVKSDGTFDKVPVLVNGVQIGIVGNTGLSTGPHLHTDLKSGGVYVNPSRAEFIVPLNSKVVIAGDYGTAGLTVGIQRPDGSLLRHLHLSRVDVPVGYIFTTTGGSTVTKEDKLTSGPVFDAKYYLATHKDVAALNNTLAYAKTHWLKHGIKEGRASTKAFCVKEYVNNYADLTRIFGTNYEAAVLHYFNSGIAEGRNGRKTVLGSTAIADLKTKIIDFVKGA